MKPFILPLLLLQSPQAIDRATIAPTVEAVLAEDSIPGVVVAIVQGPELVLLEAFGLRELETKTPMRKDDLFQIGSCTKTFTAALLVQAAAKGELELDDPLGQWLDGEHALPDWVHDVTLRQLATHTSGLPGNPVNRRNRAEGPGIMEPYSTEELYAGLADTRTNGTPGGRWSYSNLGYGLLGHVLERATEQSYEKLLRSRVLVPLGMNDSGIQPSAEQEARFAPGYWPNDSERVARPRWRFGAVCGFGGLFSSGRDMARYASALLANEDAGPFTAGTREVLFTPVIDIQPARKMAFGFFVDRIDGVEFVGHGGEVDSYSSSLTVQRSANLAVVVLANRGADSAERVSHALQVLDLEKRLTSPK
ncbi:MAG: serine hydrolase domain-containing protein [Planctomycetota bacterium]